MTEFRFSSENLNKRKHTAEEDHCSAYKIKDQNAVMDNQIKDMFRHFKQE